MENKKEVILFFAFKGLYINNNIVDFFIKRFANYEFKLNVIGSIDSIYDEIKSQILNGSKKIIVFLPSEYRDIEKELHETLNDLDMTANINVFFKYYELGLYDVIDVIEEQIRKDFSFAYKDLCPEKIQFESFNMIKNILSDIYWFRERSEEEKKIIIRVVHSLGDFSIGRMIIFSRYAIENGRKALLCENPIITDVKMVVAGISKLYKRNVFCMISSKKAKRIAKKLNITRAAASFEILRKKMNNAIVVVGNAPTALVHLIKMQKRYSILPALVIGVPVGFIGAAESKEMLMKSENNYITVRGVRGGSTVASAIINALGSL